MQPSSNHSFSFLVSRSIDTHIKNLLFDTIPIVQKLKRLALRFWALTGIIRIIEPKEELVSVYNIFKVKSRLKSILRRG
jgi:hypothetical protein